MQTKEPIQAYEGGCYRSPPAVIVVPYPNTPASPYRIETVHPTTKASDTCGEWKKKEES
jgi:hypothetical protein